MTLLVREQERQLTDYSLKTDMNITIDSIEDVPDGKLIYITIDDELLILSNLEFFLPHKLCISSNQTAQSIQKIVNETIINTELEYKKQCQIH
jgi:hypothetical protein